MPQRKRFWLYTYDQVKFRTPIQWVSLLVVSLIFAMVGMLGVWACVLRYKAGRDIDTGMAAVGVAFLAAALIESPAALIYFYRRWRGDILGYFDYEVVSDADMCGANGVDHGPDHH